MRKLNDKIKEEEEEESIRNESDLAGKNDNLKSTTILTRRFRWFEIELFKNGY